MKPNPTKGDHTRGPSGTTDPANGPGSVPPYKGDRPETPTPNWWTTGSCAPGKPGNNYPWTSPHYAATHELDAMAATCHRCPSFTACAEDQATNQDRYGFRAGIHWKQDGTGTNPRRTGNPVPLRPCAGCGHLYQPTADHKRYCSQRCAHTVARTQERNRIRDRRKQAS